LTPFPIRDIFFTIGSFLGGFFSIKLESTISSGATF
jgi:hypothetical protein